MCDGAASLVRQARDGPPSLPTSRIERNGVLERRRQMSLVLSLSYQSPVLENEKETLARP